MAVRYNSLRQIEGQLTRAQVNAGVVVVAGHTGRTLTVVDAWVRAIGGAASGNDSVDVTDTVTGTIAVSFARAGLTENTVLRAGATNATATNLGADLGAGEGIKVANVGTAMGTATALDYCISYVVEQTP
jgi:hypothetical protein